MDTRVKAARPAVIQERVMLAWFTVVAVEVMGNRQVCFVCLPVLYLSLTSVIAFLYVCFVKRD